MKNVILSIIILLGLTTALNAQTKPAAGDFGLGFKITGLANVAFNEADQDPFGTPQLLGRYYFSEKFALRLSVGLAMTNNNGTFKDDDLDATTGIRTIIDVDSTTSTFRVSLDPGIEYHLNSPAPKLDPYVGLEVNFAYLGSEEFVRAIDNQTVNAADGVVQTRTNLNSKVVTPGGIAAGASLLAGFNYFFSDNFAIGAEYELGFALRSVGGTATSSENGFIQLAPGTSATAIDTQTEFEATSTTTTMGIGTTGGVNISVFW